MGTDPVGPCCTARALLPLTVDEAADVPAALAGPDLLADAGLLANADLLAGADPLAGEVRRGDAVALPLAPSWDEAVDAPAGAGVWLWQVLDGVAAAFAFVVAVEAGVALCVGLCEDVTLALALELALAVELLLALALGLALPLVVDVTALVDPTVLGLLGGVVGLAFRAAAVGVLGVEDGHGGLAAGWVAPGEAPLNWVAPPCTAPPPGLAELAAGICWPKPCSTWRTSPWRSGGTAASTTPTANTAKPTAKAGRSIASRQSRGRCGAGRACPGVALWAVGAGCPPRIARQRRTRAARQRPTGAARTPRPADTSMAASRNVLAVA